MKNDSPDNDWLIIENRAAIHDKTGFVVGFKKNANGEWIARGVNIEACLLGDVRFNAKVPQLLEEALAVFKAQLPK